MDIAVLALGAHVVPWLLANERRERPFCSIEALGVTCRLCDASHVLLDRLESVIPVKDRQN
jgi:hypothetical protein